MTVIDNVLEPLGPGGRRRPGAESGSDAVQSVGGDVPTPELHGLTRVDPQKLRC